MPPLYFHHQGEGRQLVLLHGWGMNSTVWSPIMDELAGRFHVTRIDLPGHGGSPASALWPIDRVLPELLQAVPDRAIWAGWSLGGMLAIRVAARFPGRVAGLLTIAANPRFVRDEGWPAAIDAQQLAALGHSLEENTLRTLKRFIALQFLGTPGSRQQAAELIRRVTAALPNKQALRAGLNILRHQDLRQDFARLDCPLKALFGGHDRLVPVAAAMAVRGLNRNAVTEIFEGAGHAPFLSHPRQFIDSLKCFAHDCP